jgi:hypothetical protein
MNRNGRDPAILMLQENVAPASPNDFETDLFQDAHDFLSPSAEEDESYRDLLDANEFERANFARTTLQAQLNGFACALHEGVEVFRLRVATTQAGDCGDVVALFVPFNEDREFAGTLHRPILA